jgi:ESCRT-II complex subunit VPS25
MTSLYNSSTAQSSTISSTSTLTPQNPKSTLAYPRDYHFPPFFTRQPTATTHSSQLSKWSAWILSYSRHHRLYRLSLADAIDSDLFWNRKLGKRLSMEDAREVLEWMRSQQGRVEWITAGRDVCWVWWRTPEEWAGLIAEWVS